MELDQRIAQFEQMTRDEPANDVAWFSLGSAYAQANRPREAANAFDRCVALNPDMSKAYQLGAEQYLELDEKENALRHMKKGYEIATLNGDMLPKRAIAELFAKLDHPVPEVEDPGPEEVPEGSFVCRKTGRPGTQLDRPPFRGPVGQWIQQHISAQTWQQWIGQGTKWINELRLDLSRDEDSDVYDEKMREFIGLTDDVYEKEIAAKA